MRRFQELTELERETALDNLQDLPIFNGVRQSAQDALENSTIYVFDEDLNLKVI
jgi:hypothetical protein